MAPCNSNVITPKMIRKGEIHIGDKIEFEQEMVERAVSTAAGAAPAAAETLQAVASVEASTSLPTATPIRNGVPAFEAAAPPASEPSMPAAGEPAVSMFDKATVPAAHTAVPVATETRSTAFDSASQPMAATPQGNSSPIYTGQSAALQQNAIQQPNAGQQPSTAFQSNTASIPLIYQNMTDYVNSLENTGQQSPSFSVPSSPLVPPEYEQTIDYDSVQYMNGFLRTQIGRYMRVEQTIGSDSTEDRYGFLVGVGNNYLLLQDISNGNVAIVDLYTIKYVYMYFGEPIFPNIPFGASGR